MWQKFKYVYSNCKIFPLEDFCKKKKIFYMGSSFFECNYNQSDILNPNI